VDKVNVIETCHWCVGIN